MVNIQTAQFIYDRNACSQLVEGADIGLYHYGARFYSAKLGHFISPDSIVPGAGNPQAFNRYSYVLNNPILFNDPTGHVVACETGDVCRHDYSNSGGASSGGVVVDTGKPQKRNGGIVGDGYSSGDLPVAPPPTTAQIENVPLIRQFIDTSCGQAAFTMAWNYAYPKLPLSEIDVCA